MLQILKDNPAKYPVVIRFLVNFLVSLVIMMMGSILVLIIYVVNRVDSTADNILDCTKETGQCYQDNDSRSKLLIETINNVTVYASICIQNDEIVDITSLRNCIKAQYDLEHN